MITDKTNRWHYLAVKILSALFRGITSSNNGDFSCLNCFHSYRTFNKLKKHEKIEYLPGENSLKALFIVYVDLEWIQKKHNIVKIILKILIQRKKLNINLQDTHGIQYAHLMIQKTSTFCRGNDCNENFCKDLKELGTEIINFKEKEMIPLAYKEIKFYEQQKVCHICKKEFRDHDKNKKKVRDHCPYTGKFIGPAHSLCHLRY